MHLSFRTKLFGVVVPAIVLLLGLGWVLTNDRLNTAEAAERARVEAQVAETAMQLRDEFQNEAREAAYAVNSPADGPAILTAQQRTTDALVTKLRAEITGLPAEAKDERVVNLTDLSMASDVQTARTRVADARDGDIEDALKVYDVLDERAAALSAVLTNVGGSKELAKRTAELQSYLLAKGDYGRQLVFLGSQLNGKPVAEFEGAELHELEEVADRAFERLRLTASQATVQALAPFLLTRATLDGHTDQIVGASGGTTVPGLSLAEWRRLANESMKQFDEPEDTLFIAYAAQAADAEKAASRAAKVFGFLTLFGILVVSAGAYLIGRSLSRRLSSVTKAAHEIAVDRLPEVLESLRNPTAEAIARAVPQIETTSFDEVGQLANDFNKVLKTAIETSVEHSQRRAATLTNLLINLGRRNQALIDRQLELTVPWRVPFGHQSAGVLELLIQQGQLALAILQHPLVGLNQAFLALDAFVQRLQVGRQRRTPRK